MGAFSQDEEGEAERGVEASEYAGEMGTLFTCTGVVATGVVGATVPCGVLSEEGEPEEVPTRVSGMGATAAALGPFAATVGRGGAAGGAAGEGTTLGGDGDTGEGGDCDCTTTTAVGGGAEEATVGGGGGGATVLLGLL